MHTPYTPSRPLIARPPQRGGRHLTGGFDVLPQAVRDMVTARELRAVDLTILIALVQRHNDPHYAGPRWFPAHRELAAQLGLAPCTVQDSYRRLEGRRIVERDGKKAMWSCEAADGAFVFLRRPRGRCGRPGTIGVVLMLPDYAARTKQPSAQAPSLPDAPGQMTAPQAEIAWSAADYAEADAPQAASFVAESCTGFPRNVALESSTKKQPLHYRTEKQNLNLTNQPQTTAMVAVVCKENEDAGETTGETVGDAAQPAPTLAAHTHATKTAPPPTPSHRRNRTFQPKGPAMPRQPRRPAAPPAPHHPEIEQRLRELGVFPRTIPAVLRKLAQHDHLDLAYVEAVIAYAQAAKNAQDCTALAVSLLSDGFVPPPPRPPASGLQRTTLTLDELTAQTLAARETPTEPVLTAAERIAILRGSRG